MTRDQVSRRTFIKGVSVTAAAAAVVGSGSDVQAKSPKTPK